MGRLGQIPWNKGHKLSQSHRKALSESHKGNSGYWLGKKMTLEQRKVLSESHKGIKPSAETLKRLSELRKGESNWNFRGYSVMGKPNYQRLHIGLVKLRGKAKFHLCVDCSKPAQDWSSDTEEYLTFEEFNPRCRSCHKLHDKKLHEDRKNTDKDGK